MDKPNCVTCGNEALIVYTGKPFCGLCQIRKQKEDERREQIDIMKIAIKEIEEEKL